VPDLAIPEELTAGRLSDWSFAALLVAAQRTRARGILHLGTRDGAAEVFFEEGTPSGAAAPSGYRPLAQVLLDNGLITPEVFGDAVGAVAGGRLADEALLEKAGSDVLARAEAIRTTSILARIALEARGEFRFDGGAQPPAWAGRVGAPFVRVLLDALKAPAAEALLLAMTAELEKPGRGILFDAGQVSEVASWLEPDERALASGLRAGGDYLNGNPGARRVAAGLLLVGVALAVDYAEEAARAEHEAQARLARSLRGTAEASRAKRLEEAQRKGAQARRRAVPADFGAVDLEAALPEPEAGAIVPEVAPAEETTGRHEVPLFDEAEAARQTTQPIPVATDQRQSDTGRFGHSDEEREYLAQLARRATETPPAETMQPVRLDNGSDVSTAPVPEIPPEATIEAVDTTTEEQVGLWNIAQSPTASASVNDGTPSIWGPSAQVNAAPIIEADWENLQPIQPEPVEPSRPIQPIPAEPYAAPPQVSVQGVPAEERYVEQVIELTEEAPKVESEEPLGLFAQPRPVYLTPRPGTLAPAELPQDFMAPPADSVPASVDWGQSADSGPYSQPVPIQPEPVAQTLPPDEPPELVAEPIVPEPYRPTTPEPVIEAAWLEAPQEAAPPLPPEPPASILRADGVTNPSPVVESRLYDPEFSAKRSAANLESVRPYDPEFGARADAGNRNSYLDSVSALTDQVADVDEGHSLGMFATPQAGLPADDQDGRPPVDADRMGDDVKYRSDDERERRQRLLRKAIENLGVLRPPSAEGARIEPAKPALEESGATAASSGEVLTAEEANLAERIEAKHRSIDREDYFARLGVARTSSKEQVKTWFFQLAKVYHPDRLPPALAHLAPKASDIFERLREAHDTLSDDKRRAEYLGQIGRGPQFEARSAGPSRSAAKDDAKVQAAQGEASLRKRDFAAAEKHFERAHELDPLAEYLAGQAWAIYLDPARKGDLELAKSMLGDALRASPECDRAQYYSGVVARVEGNSDLAERYFRNAVRANPKHTEAQQELRLIEMRKQKTDKPKTDKPKKGFFR
jgi:curved DNA-binding protein CbpA